MSIYDKNVTVKTKRIYEAPAPGDGLRVLVDRLWPRGMTKEKAHIDLWLKEIAPSDELRRKFHHQPEKWKELRREYLDELERKENIISDALMGSKERIVTLLFSARDPQFNNAAVLREFLESRGVRRQ